MDAVEPAACDSFEKGFPKKQVMIRLESQQGRTVPGQQASGSDKPQRMDSTRVLLLLRHVGAPSARQYHAASPENETVMANPWYRVPKSRQKERT
ncbi:hypothetical protein A7K73_04980 [Candidatus Methylacidiphilum fumarolicum]|uniref:hypothetical protein n=2 Tax=Candidatus Methylacidiphilum fumarolicum TaxID=591154 RepID=UPI0006626817|nr:hypothetical protein [Candidatus Methylacidiphilum fumarolicum]TFE69963.1 hypothetical protein A7K73_04980 [Candidatus Methylacidiphilum fumarolicum]TFE76791.1 hypothetical protein A7D33_08365 [Candidatus Methylacidiphilum fumarolicum]